MATQSEPSLKVRNRCWRTGPRSHKKRYLFLKILIINIQIFSIYVVVSYLFYHKIYTFKAFISKRISGTIVLMNIYTHIYFSVKVKCIYHSLACFTVQSSFFFLLYEYTYFCSHAYVRHTNFFERCHCAN